MAMAQPMLIEYISTDRTSSPLIINVKCVAVLFYYTILNPQITACPVVSILKNSFG